MRQHAPRVFAVLIGLTALAVLLQGLWAGLFLPKKGDAAEGWVEVHARGGEIALALAVLATLVGFVWIRARRDLWVGSAVAVVLLAVEGWLGGEISDGGKSSLTAVHVPLAMALMALVTWLSFRSARQRSLGDDETADLRGERATAARG
ncbi:MAG TPA: hypothetical protein VFS29_10275 [Motilibacteraceae bacterium]|nr:hypothetical protein [Motilibacteraceae bacterium]